MGNLCQRLQGEADILALRGRDRLPPKQRRQVENRLIRFGGGPQDSIRGTFGIGIVDIQNGFVSIDTLQVQPIFGDLIWVLTVLIHTYHGNCW